MIDSYILKVLDKVGSDGRHLARMMHKPGSRRTALLLS